MTKYCNIIENSEEGLADFTFDIINYKKKLFGNRYIECAAKDGETIVGFKLEIKGNMTGLVYNDINTWHTYQDGMKILYLDNYSNDLLKVMSKYYELDNNNYKLNSSSMIECGYLMIRPLNYKWTTVKFKCFINSNSNEDIYGEFYINIDLKNKKLYLNEKSTEYRENIIK